MKGTVSKKEKKWNFPLRVRTQPASTLNGKKGEGYLAGHAPPNNWESQKTSQKDRERRNMISNKGSKGARSRAKNDKRRKGVEDDSGSQGASKGEEEEIRDGQGGLGSNPPNIHPFYGATHPSWLSNTGGQGATRGSHGHPYHQHSS